MSRRLVQTCAVLGAAAVVTVGPAALTSTGVNSAVAHAATATPAQPRIGPPCEPGRLCVFAEPNFTGARTDLFTCTAGPVDVRPKLGRVGSYVNNQTGDQVAEFYRENPPGAPEYAFTSTAVDARADTTGEAIYYVKPC